MTDRTPRLNGHRQSDDQSKDPGIANELPYRDPAFRSRLSAFPTTPFGRNYTTRRRQLALLSADAGSWDMRRLKLSDPQTPIPDWSAAHCFLAELSAGKPLVDHECTPGVPANSPLCCENFPVTVVGGCRGG